MQENNQPLKKKKKKKLPIFLAALLLWIALGTAVTQLFGVREAEELHVSILPERILVAGVSLNGCVFISLCITLGLALLAIALRVFVIPRFTDRPKGIQNVLELMVESIRNYTSDKSGIASVNLGAYILTLALFLVGCSLSELLGQRSPSADITLTLTIALISFMLIIYYGVRAHGGLGYMKTFAQPTPIVFPIRILTEIALPISMACRLFGNMLGGMIIMELLYMALNNFASGIPAVAGLYFQAFHPLIQVFIFVTLTLTFIGETQEHSLPVAPANR